MRMSLKIEAKQKEAIISGQYMISNFEQENFEDYQDPDDTVDDDDSCEEIIDTTVASKLLPGTSSSSTTATLCNQLEKYKTPSTGKHHEIDSDLSQVFNTLNVTYK